VQYWTPEKVVYGVAAAAVIVAGAIGSVIVVEHKHRTEVNRMAFQAIQPFDKIVQKTQRDNLNESNTTLDDLGHRICYEYRFEGLKIGEDRKYLIHNNAFVAADSSNPPLTNEEVYEAAGALKNVASGTRRLGDRTANVFFAGLVGVFAITTGICYLGTRTPVPA